MEGKTVCYQSHSGVLATFSESSGGVSAIKWWLLAGLRLEMLLEESGANVCLSAPRRGWKRAGTLGRQCFVYDEVMTVM